MAKLLATAHKIAQHHLYPCAATAIATRARKITNPAQRIARLPHRIAVMAYAIWSRKTRYHVRKIVLKICVAMGFVTPPLVKAVPPVPLTVQKLIHTLVETQFARAVYLKPTQIVLVIVHQHAEMVLVIYIRQRAILSKRIQGFGIKACLIQSGKPGKIAQTIVFLIVGTIYANLKLEKIA